ncbi:MAG: ATP-binding cassette domain-containing protein, partial [Candidatus Aureabacteria bacterium]|nr:ATP-binding cassette domain-containing protein [Candidatus Auribacterota bacterium]
IVGPNGAGKTTLLLALLGEVPYRGRIIISGHEGGRCSRIGYVPQRLAFDRGIPITVTEFLTMGVQRKPLWLGINRPLRAQALQLLASVDAGYLAARRLGALSGGEMQRVLLHHATHVICLNRRVAAEGPPRTTLTCDNLLAVFGPHMGVIDLRAIQPGGVTTCALPREEEHHV